MLQCIFRLCVRVLKLGYNGVQRVGGVFGGGQFFRRRRRRGSCFFLFFWGRLLVDREVAFLDTWRNRCVGEYFLLLLLLINKVSPRRFLFVLFGDECRRRRRRCVSRFHPLSFCLSLSVCLSLSLCLVRAMT